MLRIYKYPFAVGDARGETRRDCDGDPSTPGRLLSLCLHAVVRDRWI
jgi:hypothetical protein